MKELFKKLSISIALFLIIFSVSSAQSFIYLKNASGELEATIVYKESFINKYFKVNALCIAKKLEGITCEYVDPSSPLAGSPRTAVKLVNNSLPENDLNGVKSALNDIAQRLEEVANIKPSNNIISDAPVAPVAGNETVYGSNNPNPNTGISSNFQATQVSPTFSAPQYNSPQPQTIYQVIERAVPGPQGPAGRDGKDAPSSILSRASEVVSMFFPSIAPSSQYIGYGAGENNMPNEDANFKSLSVSGDVSGADANFSGTLSAGVLLIASSTVGSVTTNAAIIVSSTITSATATNLYTDNASIQNSSIQNLTTNNNIVNNSTITNLYSLSTEGDFATITNATATNLFASLFNALNAVFGALFASSASITTINASTTNASTTNTGDLSVSGTANIAGTSTLATTTISSSTINNLNAGNVVINNSTTTNFYSTNASTANSTSTNFFSALLSALDAVINNLFVSSATITNGTSTNFAVSGNLDANNASLLNATATNFFATNSSTTNQTSINTNTNNLNADNATITNSTTSNSYSTNSSSTNLSSTNGNFGNLTANNATITNSTSTNIYSQNASITQANTQNFIASYATIANATTTSLFASLFSALYGSLSELIATNATITNATITNIFAGGAFNVSNGAGTNGQILQTTGTSAIWVSTSTLGFSGTGGGSTNYLSLFSAEVSGSVQSGTLSGITSVYDFEPFTIGSDSYLAVSNGGSTIEVLKWNGSTFAAFQSVPSSAPYESHFFTIGSDYYLLAAEFSGSARVWKWNGSSFAAFQTLATSGALGAKSTEISGVTYLGLNIYGGGSAVYYWNGTNFSFLQSLGTGSPYNLDFGTIGSHTFLGVGSISGAVYVYEWNGSSFVSTQTLGGPQTAGATFMNIGSDLYLFQSNFNNGNGATSVLYKWNGSSFVSYQNITTYGAYDAEFYVSGGSYYLAIAYGKNGGSYVVNSEVYKWNGSQLSLQNTITTDTASEFSHFFVGTKEFLLAAETNASGIPLYSPTYSVTSGGTSALTAGLLYSDGTNVTSSSTLSTLSLTNLLASYATITNATATSLNLTGAFGSSNGVGTWGQILMSLGTTTQWISTSSLGISSGGSSLPASTTSLYVGANGNVGIASSSPGSILSIGSVNGINFTTGTSTFSSAGGINLTNGCFAIAGVCIGEGSLLPASSTSLYVGSNGNVGIGSSTPAEKLGVQGNALISGNLKVNGTASFSSFGGVTLEATGGTITCGFEEVNNIVATTSVIAVSPTTNGSCTVTGIAGGVDGKIVYLRNVSTTAYFMIANGSASSIATNRIVTDTGSDGQLNRYSWVALIYDGTSSRWRVLNEGAETAMSSDQRLKKNITELTSVSDRIASTTFVSYNWNELGNELGHSSDKTQYGVIAQQLQQNFPDVVGSSSNGYFNVNYQALYIYGLQAIKEVVMKVNKMAETFVTKLLKTEVLCLTDESGETCINRAQFKEVFNKDDGVILPPTGTTTTVWVDPTTGASTEPTTSTTTDPVVPPEETPTTDPVPTEEPPADPAPTTTEVTTTN